MFTNFKICPALLKIESKQIEFSTLILEFYPTRTKKFCGPDLTLGFPTLHYEMEIKSDQIEIVNVSFWNFTLPGQKFFWSGSNFGFPWFKVLLDYT